MGHRSYRSSPNLTLQFGLYCNLERGALCCPLAAGVRCANLDAHTAIAHPSPGTSVRRDGKVTGAGGCFPDWR